MENLLISEVCTERMYNASVHTHAQRTLRSQADPSWWVVRRWAWRPFGFPRPLSRSTRRWSTLAALRRQGAHLQRSPDMARSAAKTEQYIACTVSIYSTEKLLVCGAQIARTHNTTGVGADTQRCAPWKSDRKPAANFGQSTRTSRLERPAVHAREPLDRADTPCGGAAHLERSAA